MDAISCLAPPPAALLPSSSYPYADAAIARAALHFSADSSSSSSSLSHHAPLLTALPSPYYAPPPHDSVLVADSPRRRRSSPRQNHAPAPAGARAGIGKRRSRASKRAPTTYISTDAANFRLMVQQITGVQADAAAGGDVSGVEVAMLQVQATAALDAAALLGNPHLLPPPPADEASALRQHQLQLQQQQQPCFPTLDSWNVSNVMYETNSAEML